jgi:hypothetical protein
MHGSLRLNFSSSSGSTHQMPRLSLDQPSIGVVALSEFPQTISDSVVRVLLNAEAWEAFSKALQAPPRRHERMERLLNEPSVLE